MKTIVFIITFFIGFWLDDKVKSPEDVISDHLAAFPEHCEVAIGIIQGDKEIKLGYQKRNGELIPVENSETLFEIGSATKVFTAALLANEISKGTISLDDPVQQHLEVNIGKDSFRQEHIRIKHLATHTSGLKGRPFMSYKKYSRYLEKLELDAPPGENWSYNNLALALLGHIIIQKNGSSWNELLRQQILEPLEMNNTYTTSAEAPLENRMRCFKKNGSGRDCKFEVQQPFIWPSGAMVSNIEDMLKWIRANLDMEGLPSDLQYLDLAHHPLRDSIKTGFKDESTQGIVWWHLINPEEERILCHGGTTPDHTIFVAFDKANQMGAVVYANITWPLLRNDDGSLKTNELGLELLKMELP